MPVILPLEVYGSLPHEPCDGRDNKAPSGALGQQRGCYYVTNTIPLTLTHNDKIQRCVLRIRWNVLLHIIFDFIFI